MTACAEELPVAQETPPRSFVLGGVRIDDRQADGASWKGTAARAEGSLDESEFEDIVLTVTTADPVRVYQIRAPRGTMSFETRTGVFQDLVVTDEQGGVLRAGRGLFDGEAQTLTTEGPMTFVAQGMEMSAPRGVVDLETGNIAVEGPVQGRYEATLKRREPRGP